MGDYLVRPIESKDIAQVKVLLRKSFGCLVIQENAFYPIMGRYIVAVDGDKVAGVSGITDKSPFNGYEIDWTCVDEKYRHKGIMIDILKYAIDRLPYNHIPVYCSCWRIRDNEEINLHSSMKALGFELCQKAHKALIKGEYKACIDCPYSCESCYCFCDLYKLRR